MSAIPYENLGKDKDGAPFFSDASPVGPAKKQYLSENGTASSVMTLTDNTTVVEVGAVGAAVYLRWVPRTETAAVAPYGSVIAIAGATANFDDYVPPNTTRIFPIPQETIGTSSIVGANVAAGLYNRLAVKSAGIASVITVEF